MSHEPVSINLPSRVKTDGVFSCFRLDCFASVTPTSIGPLLFYTQS